MNLKVLMIFVFCAVASSAFAQPTPKDVGIAIPAHDITSGAKISEDDLTYESVSAARAGSNMVRTIPDAADTVRVGAPKDGAVANNMAQAQP